MLQDTAASQGTEPRHLMDAYLAGRCDAVALVDGWLTAATAPFAKRLGTDAADALQEARVATLQVFRSQRFRGDASLKTFVWQVACHTCQHALRRRSRALTLEEDLDARPSDAPSPLDGLLRRERHDRVQAVLATTSPECRQIWRLMLEGFSYREISRQLGVSEGALRVRAHRGRKGVAKLMQGRHAHA